MLRRPVAVETDPPPDRTADDAACHACPLADCPHRARTADDLYCHLLVGHRKSDLGTALLDR